VVDLRVGVFRMREAVSCCMDWSSGAACGEAMEKEGVFKTKCIYTAVLSIRKTMEKCTIPCPLDLATCWSHLVHTTLP